MRVSSSASKIIRLNLVLANLSDTQSYWNVAKEEGVWVL